MTIQKIEEDWRSYPMNDEELEKMCKETFNEMYLQYSCMVMGDLQSVAKFIEMLLKRKKEGKKETVN